MTLHGPSFKADSDFRGVDRSFPIALDVKYGSPAFDERSAFSSKLYRSVATILVATDGSGDYEDIQKAIDALPTEGGVIYLKEGTYTITSRINVNKSNMTIVGTGYGTIIQTTDNVACFYFNQKDNLVLRDVHLVGTNSGLSQHGVLTSHCNTFQINGVAIEDMGGHGILLGPFSNRGRVLNNEILDCGVNGITLVGDYPIVSNNTIDSCSKQGIYAVATVSFIIAGNNISSCGREGILISGGNRGCINGNVIGACGTEAASTYSGITLSSSYSCSVVGNVCRSNLHYGIDISDSACTENVVTGNPLKSNSSGGLNNQGTDTEIGHNLES